MLKKDRPGGSNMMKRIFIHRHPMSMFYIPWSRDINVTSHGEDKHMDKFEKGMLNGNRALIYLSASYSITKTHVKNRNCSKLTHHNYMNWIIMFNCQC